VLTYQRLYPLSVYHVWKTDALVQIEIQFSKKQILLSSYEIKKLSTHDSVYHFQHVKHRIPMRIS
jgi:hypothetical protein